MHNSGNDKLLTIAIPTYNRNEKLKRSIDLIVPQLCSRVQIKVFDNCSDIPVSETLSSVIYSDVNVIRNRYNVGLAGNILKCIEYCDTQWLWILGDDDPPMLGAISQVLGDIDKYSDCSYINYKSHMASHRLNTFCTKGPEELIKGIDDFGNLLFISLGVFNLDKLKGDLRLSYQLAYSIAPHMVYLFSGLNDKSKVVFSHIQIHDFSIHDTSRDETWSWLTLSLCFGVLYEIPLKVSAEAKSIFAKHVLTHVKSPKEIFSVLESVSYINIPTYEKRYLLRQIFFRSLLFKGFDLKLFSFIFYDLKLIIKGIVFSRKIELDNKQRYERI